MPKREDLKKILIIGSGPIVIGQACEFDYSGTQACKALREEGYEVVLVNNNPATIMTDPEMAERVYIEPITAESIERIIETERPDALLPTLGGQTALNVALELADRGALSRYDVEMIGAKKRAIEKAEDRDLFKEAMLAAGLKVPKSGFVYSLRDARKVAEEIGYPIILRPSLTLGGTGGGIVYKPEGLEAAIIHALDLSPRREVLLEQSVIGWKEFELEVMRDREDNVVVICSIENFDPMGIHTGDSITVAPAQTLTDKEYQRMRDAAAKVIRTVGVETGGSNIQFAIDPGTGEIMVIEMNPRVSRSSALASKATGFPIAKIAAKLAVGYTLDELPNDITKETRACFEPTIDYVVVKIPRWAFEKFPEADPHLHTQMKSVGEVMAIGRTFKEALQKAVRSLEISLVGLSAADGQLERLEDEELLAKLAEPLAERLFYLYQAVKRGIEVEKLAKATGIDPWFIDQLCQIAETEKKLYAVKATTNGSARLTMKDARSFVCEGEPVAAASAQEGGESHQSALAGGLRVPARLMREAKQHGFSDAELAAIWHADEEEVRATREKMGVLPTHKLVDTCAAEFEAYTPYYYSTYESEDESRISDKKKILIVGAGPNRIGQGIEFDYCCVHAALGLREDGYETIMVNSNPETVSTDYDISDKLYFEPLTLEDVLNITDKEKPQGVIVQFGGQTPLNLAMSLSRAGVKIIGTDPDSIDRAEDRQRFRELIEKLGLVQPPNDTATSIQEARRIARSIGYPVLVRPSYVLGGRAMEIVYGEESLEQYMRSAVRASRDHPVLIDKFLEDAIEIDVDAIADGERVVIGGIMEHIEEAGIHSGDSACVLPPFSLAEDEIQMVRDQTEALARELKVVGLMNIQFAVRNEVLHVLEVNPRASRTVPFVSKAIGVPLAKLAARVMGGKTLEELGFTEEVKIEHTAVKCPVFPFSKLTGCDPILGPEMKSTGEVMGLDYDFGRAFAKAYVGAGHRLPTSGTVFLSVKNKDKRDVIFIARTLRDRGFKIVATHGTAVVLRRNGIEATTVHRISDAQPNVLDLLTTRKIDLIINTPSGKVPKEDQARIRRCALENDVPCITTIQGAMAAVGAIESLARGELSYHAIQDYYRN